MSDRTVFAALPARDIVCVAPTDTVLHAACLMAGAGCGSALVLTAGMVVGIITERDVLNRIVAQTADPASTAVEAVMTRKPVCAHPDMPVVHALYTMKELGFRHFPVINDKHEPLGVFCLRDAFPEELAGAAYLKKSLQKMIKTQRH